MITQNWKDKLHRSIQLLQTYADRQWYPPFIAFLAAMDNLIIIIPNDGILISSSMLIPKRWFIFAFFVAIGSTLGAIALAALVELQGLPWILETYPGLRENQFWTITLHFFEKYGNLVVFVVALTPIMQHPAVILASLADTPLDELAGIIFSGRFIKFLIMAYVGSHAPKLLKKLWGLKDELQEVGVKLK